MVLYDSIDDLSICIQLGHHVFPNHEYKFKPIYQMSAAIQLLFLGIYKTKYEA
jgi:hypothetical protein